MAVDPAAELWSQLACHRPVDAREAMSVEQLRSGLIRWARPFDERAGPAHVTGSAIVVGRRGVVLHRHRRLGRWLQPGGHVERGEPVSAAARREAAEETGLTVWHPPAGPRLLHVDVHPGPRGHTHLDVRYLLAADDVEPAPPPGESQAVAWFGWDAALGLADASLRGALVAARRALSRG
jgi:8-oxo-dGTP pyrophosphatase MutT (NUDIX family)